MSLDSNIKLVMRYKLIYSMTGLVVGVICALGGIILFLEGVTGSSSWTAKILGTESTLSDAAPGALLFIVGLFIVIATRYSPKLDYETTTTREGTEEQPNPAPASEGGKKAQTVKTISTQKQTVHVRTAAKARVKAAARKSRRK